VKPQDFEHERKFLVADTSIVDATQEGTSIVQGYFPCAPGFSVRVRSYPTLDTYQFTVKGPRQGISRLEEEDVLTAGGETALLAAGEWIVEKTRYPAVGPDGLGWDIDVFHQRNDGLVLAELELKEPNATFEIPEWCGAEVTADRRYYNDQLAFNPYSNWREDKPQVP